MISSLQLNPLSSALSVVFKCFMHTMSSLWKPHECYFLFMPSESLLIILWQCLESLNKTGAISASHCPSSMAASKAGIWYFWAWDTSPFHTLARPKYVWNPSPTSAALVSIRRRVWCMGQTGAIAWPSRDPKVRGCSSQCWSATTRFCTAGPMWLGMRLCPREKMSYKIRLCHPAVCEWEKMRHKEIDHPAKSIEESETEVIS